MPDLNIFPLISSFESLLLHLLTGNITIESITSSEMHR